MQPELTLDKLIYIAKDNYSTLRKYCSILDSEGYWEGPESILKISIYEMLDKYIQSVLIQVAISCENYTENEAKFISLVPKQNVLNIQIGEELSDKLIYETNQMISSPPILLQLTGWRDGEKKSGLTGLFFDALLNIMLSMAYINISKAVYLTKFVKNYYQKIEMFLYNQPGYSNYIDEKYIFLKLCNGELEHSNERLLEAGEDFDYYKRKYLFYKKSTLKDASGMQEKAEIRKAEEIVIINESDKKSNEEELDKDNNLQKDNLINEKEDSENRFKDFEQNSSGKLDKKDAIDSKILRKASDSRLESLLKELDNLIGLEQVKSEIRSLVNLIKVKKMRESMKLPSMDMTFHMVFTGSPGTGKTTVARLIAKIYHELGLLSKDILVETDRSGLVAGYVGQTALKVKEVVDKAKGGVLFIDEAYALSSTSSNDFGEEAIDTLVKLMEDNRENLVVIVAGYTKEMNKFLKSNTGLVSRFNKFINFLDYSNSELIDILNSMASKAGFKLEEKAIDKIRYMLETMTDDEIKRFGNARGIRNLFERLVMNQANRVVELTELNEEVLTTISIEDVKDEDITSLTF